MSQSSVRLNPPLAEDAALCSVVDASRRLLCEPSARHAARRFTGLDHCDLTSPLPRWIGRFSECVLQTPLELLHRHTVFPLHVPFLTPETVEALVQSVSGVSATKSHRTPSPWVAPRCGSRLSFCSACRDEDVAETGFPVWKRSHQIFGIDCCWKHNLILLTACPNCGQGVARLRGWEPPPSRCACGTPLESLPVTCPMERRLARLAHELIHANVPASTRGVLGSTYRSALRARGFRKWRHLRVRESVEAIESNWGRDFLSAKSALTNQVNLNSERILWIATGREPLAWPLANLLVIGWLFDDDVSAFFAAREATASRRSYEASSRRRASLIDDAQTVEHIRMLVLNGVSLRTLMREAGDVGWSKLAELCVRHDIPLKLPVDKVQIKEIQKLASAGRSIEEISLLVGVKAYIVKAVLAASPEGTPATRKREQSRQRDRAALLSMKRAGLIATRSELYMANPPLARRLQRRDKSWLHSELPDDGRRRNSRRVVVHWSELDSSLSDRLPELVSRIREQVVPRRVTAAAIEERLGYRRGWISANKARLPAFSAKVMAVIERGAEFRQRRFGHAVSEALQERLADVARKYGMSPRSLRQVRAEMRAI